MATAARAALVAAATVALAAAADRAHVVVFKELVGEGVRNLLVQNHNFTVHYHVFNRGNGTAYNVRLHDEWPADTFNVVAGTSDAVWPELAAGSHESRSLIVQCKVFGRLTASPARLEYALQPAKEEGAAGAADEEAEEDEEEDEEEEDGEEVVAYSNSVPPTQMLQEAEYGRVTVDEDTVHRVTISAGLLLVASFVYRWVTAKALNDAAAKATTTSA